MIPKPSYLVLSCTAHVFDTIPQRGSPLVFGIYDDQSSLSTNQEFDFSSLQMPPQIWLLKTFIFKY
jgi:hypothetical protein